MKWVRFRILLAGTVIAAWRYPVRSALTLIAVMLGVAFTVGFMAVSEGSRQQLHRQVDTLGTDVIIVSPDPGAVLTIEDAGALVDAELAPDVALVAPEAAIQAISAVEDNEAAVTVLGTTPEYATIRGLVMDKGRFLNPRDVAVRAPVAVLGHSAADLIIPLATRVGQVVRLNGRPFDSVGFLEPTALTANSALERTIIVPITVVQFRFAGQFRLAGGPARGMAMPLRAINIQARPGRVDEAVEQVGEILKRRHGRVDFGIVTQGSLAAEFRDVADVYRLLLGTMAAVSLLAAAIGVTNLMLSFVGDRRLEIGVRMAVGARRRDVLRQFLGEAVVLSVAGGILGVALGWPVTGLFDELTVADQTFRPITRGYAAFVAIGVAAGVGLVGGLYPAYRAARVDPVEALR